MVIVHQYIPTSKCNTLFVYVYLHECMVIVLQTIRTSTCNPLFIHIYVLFMNIICYIEELHMVIGGQTFFMLDVQPSNHHTSLTHRETQADTQTCVLLTQLGDGGLSDCSHCVVFVILHSLRLKMRHFLLTFDALSPFHSHLNTLYCKSLSLPLTLGLHQSFHCSTSAQQRQLVVSSDTLRLELNSICDTKNCREKYSCIHSFIGTLNVQ